MPRVCLQCGAEMPDISSFCAACGIPIADANPPVKATVGLNDRLAGALSYATFVPAAVFLLVKPFNKNSFLRFHSFQSIFLTIAGAVIAIALRLLFDILALIPVLGHFLVLLLAMVALLGGLTLWIVLLVKALQGEIFKLPFLGDLSEKQAKLRT